MNQKSDAPDWSSYKLGWEDGVMAERQSHRQTHLHTAPCQTCQSLAMAVMNDQTYHEKVIPKREWVGLTDEEIYDCADKFLYQHGSNYSIKSFGKAIETKLKEKNHGQS